MGEIDEVRRRFANTCPRAGMDCGVRPEARAGNLRWSVYGARRAEGKPSFPGYLQGDDAERSPSTAGWCIIILAVMFVISLLVMIGKAMLVAQDQETERVPEGISGDCRAIPTALDRDEAQGRAPATPRSTRSPFMPHFGEGKIWCKFSDPVSPVSPACRKWPAASA